EDAHFAECLARLHAGQNLLDPSGDRPRDDDAALLDDEQLLALVSHAEEDLALAKASLDEGVPQLAQHGFLDFVEEGHLPEKIDLGQPIHDACLTDRAGRDRRPLRWPTASA